MSTALILTAGAMRLWAAGARPGAIGVYHVGALAQDRMDDPLTDQIAALAMALQEAGIISLLCARVAIGGMTCYAARLARRDPTHPLVEGLLSPLEWRALRALVDREERVSAERHVARSLGVCEGEARAVLSGLRARGWAVQRPSERGPMQTAPSEMAWPYVSVA